MTSHQTSRHSRYSHLNGLYLIVDERWATSYSLAEVVQEAGRAGVTLVQYRNKTGSMQQAYAAARQLRAITKEWGMLFVVNDRCDLAMAVEADGVHLGQTDLPVALARNVVGPDMLIGLSTHNAEQVQAAMNEDVDYLGFGPIFPTDTKINHDPVVGLQGFKEIRALTPLPIFAIGGIVPESASQLCEAGANGVAVASGILEAVDRPEAFKQFLAAFRKGA